MSTSLAALQRVRGAVAPVALPLDTSLLVQTTANLPVCMLCVVDLLMFYYSLHPAPIKSLLRTHHITYFSDGTDP